MDDLFGDDNVVPVSETTAVPLPAGDLRAEIDNEIEQHIANTIEKLTDDLQREYLHWKKPISRNRLKLYETLRVTTFGL